MSSASCVQFEDKPLLDLIKNLADCVENDKKIALSDTQILKILDKDIGLNYIWSAHALEIDVYSEIIKRYIKKWPNWENVAKALRNAKKDPNINIDEILNNEYEELKKYLKELIMLSKDITEKNVEKVKKFTAEQEKEREKEGTSKDNVVLEITCSRSQLNKLFFAQPNPQLGGTIFNVDPTVSKKTLNLVKLEELIYWPNLSFNITIGAYEFVRINKHHLEHTLINKKSTCPTTPPSECRNDGLYVKTTNKSLHGNNIDKDASINFYKKVMCKLPENTPHKDFILQLLYTIIKELNRNRPNIDQGCDYMYFPSKFPYVRYLQSDISSLDQVDPSSPINYNDYLLHLEEIIKPSVIYRLKLNLVEGSFKSIVTSLKKPTNPWIKVECLECEEKFVGIDKMNALKDHVINNHSDELDVRCTGCKKEFTMCCMTLKGWEHECGPMQ